MFDIKRGKNQALGKEQLFYFVLLKKQVNYLTKMIIY